MKKENYNQKEETRNQITDNFDSIEITNIDDDEWLDSVLLIYTSLGHSSCLAD